jgi:hypothetical protein
MLLAVSAMRSSGARCLPQMMPCSACTVHIYTQQQYGLLSLIFCVSQPYMGGTHPRCSQVSEGGAVVATAVHSTDTARSSIATVPLSRGTGVFVQESAVVLHSTTS